METSQKGTAEPIVLLVHGTGAGDKSGIGERWWQLESKFQADLLERLGSQYSWPTEPEVFHWSGENSERERQAAAADLLLKLIALSRAGRPIHIIGHSHGGSVIWSALARACAESRQDTLRIASIACIGTPFIALGARPIKGVDWVLAAIGAGALFSGGLGLSRLVEFFSLMEREGDWAAAFGVPLAATLSLGIGIFLLLRIGLLLATRAQYRHAVVAMRSAVERWGDITKFIWSSSDEAINGLSQTLKYSPAIMPRVSKGEPRTFRTSIFLAFAYPFLRAYDAILAPAIDDFIWKRLMRRLQGNDLPYAEVTTIASLPPGVAMHNGLPPEIDEALVTKADDAAGAAIRRIRATFGQLAPGGGVTGFVHGLVQKLTWRELVHNSYFENLELRQLISTHLGESSTARCVQPRSSMSAPAELVVKPRAAPNFARAAVLVSMSLILLGLLYGYNVAFTNPYTNAYQIDAILNGTEPLQSHDKLSREDQEISVSFIRNLQRLAPGSRAERRIDQFLYADDVGPTDKGKKDARSLKQRLLEKAPSLIKAELLAGISNWSDADRYHGFDEYVADLEEKVRTTSWDGSAFVPLADALSRLGQRDRLNALADILEDLARERPERVVELQLYADLVATYAGRKSLPFSVELFESQIDIQGHEAPQRAADLLTLYQRTGILAQHYEFVHSSIELARARIIDLKSYMKGARDAVKLNSPPAVLLQLNRIASPTDSKETLRLLFALASSEGSDVWPAAMLETLEQDRDLGLYFKDPKPGIAAMATVLCADPEAAAPCDQLLLMLAADVYRAFAKDPASTMPIHDWYAVHAPNADATLTDLQIARVMQGAWGNGDIGIDLAAAFLDGPSDPVTRVSDRESARPLDVPDRQHLFTLDIAVIRLLTLYGRQDLARTLLDRILQHGYPMQQLDAALADRDERFVLSPREDGQACERLDDTRAIKSLSISVPFEQLTNPYRLGEIAYALLLQGRSEEADIAANRGHCFLPSESDYGTRMKAKLTLGLTFAGLERFREARLICADCPPAYRLQVYNAILDEVH